MAFITGQSWFIERSLTPIKHALFRHVEGHTWNHVRKEKGGAVIQIYVFGEGRGVQII